MIKLFLMLSFLAVTEKPMANYLGQEETVKEGFSHFTASTNSEGVDLAWQLDSEASFKEVIIERRREGEAFALLTAVNASSIDFRDDLAFFGIFQYRLKVVDAKGIYYSEVVEVETYMGGDFTRLYPLDGIDKGSPINIVFGHMSKSDTVTTVFYNTSAEMIGNPSEQVLTNQLLKIKTESLIAGQYVCIVKGRDWPVSIFRFNIK